MRLEFSGAPEIKASRALVWERLLDAAFVGRCAPGVRSVEAIAEDRFRVNAGFGAGSVNLTFVMEVTLTDLAAPMQARMTASGKAPGSEVRIDGVTHLEEMEPDRTRLSWSMTAEIHGSVVNVGARVLTGTASRLAGLFWKRFTKRVAAAAAEADSQPRTPSA